MIRQLEPMAMDRWITRVAAHDAPFDLTSSTGPCWRLDELLALASPKGRDLFSRARLSYSPVLGRDDLREAIAMQHDVDPSTVIVTVGASEALHIIFLDVARLGGNVVIPDPCFPPMYSLPRAFGMEVRRYALRREEAYRLPVGAIEAETDGRTRLVLINSPHNPTGAIATDGEIEAVFEICDRVGARLVVDEVFRPLYLNGHQRSAARLSGVVVVGDFSKAWCLSGLRTGWLIDRDPKSRSRYFDLHANFVISGPPLSEILALIACAAFDTIIRRATETLKRNVALFGSFMRQRQSVLDWVPPAGGTTVFPWRQDGLSASSMCERAALKGVPVIPGEYFGHPEHFRLGLGAVDDLEGALERLEDVLASN